METKAKNLTASRVLKLSYCDIFKGNSERINLSRRIWAKIGDDSDGHKTREFFMAYNFSKKVLIAVAF